MRKKVCSVLIILVMGAWLSLLAVGEEEGFVPLFNGKDLTGWRVESGEATYSVQHGSIVGECRPGTKNNTFLVYEKEYGNFVLKLDFKVIVPGNSGVQFRSHLRSEGKLKILFGYQAEIDPSAKNETGRIYDEGRRGFRYDRIWLDEKTTPEVLKAAQDTHKPGDWNSLEIQCVGPSLRTWVNGVPVANMVDPMDLSGLIGLQIHAGSQGTIAWRNIRIKDMGVSSWHKFFVGEGENTKLVGARFILPQEWTFVKEGYLKGKHSPKEKRDGLVVSDQEYADFAVRVDYRIFGGNSGLYFRADENPQIDWFLRGFQNEIADDKSPEVKNMSGGLWHTGGFNSAGVRVIGRHWLGRNESFVAKLRHDNDWNSLCTIAIGRKMVNFMNDFPVVYLNDELYDQPKGKVGLQLHGSTNSEMWFKNFEVLSITPEMKKWIER